MLDIQWSTIQWSVRPACGSAGILYVDIDANFCS